MTLACRVSILYFTHPTWNEDSRVLSAHVCPPLLSNRDGDMEMRQATLTPNPHNTYL